jgi:hypothetical protein
MKARAGFAVLCLLGIFFTGCAKKPAEPVHVKGSITCEGKPANGVLVTFWPENGRHRCASALADQAGKFSLECVSGVYKVTVTPNLQDASAPGIEGGSSAAAPNLPRPALAIPGHYSATSTTPLQVDVPEGGSNNLVLTLVR